MNGHKQKIFRVAIMAILGIFFWSGMITAPANAESVGCYPTLSNPCSDWTRVQSGQVVFDYHFDGQKLTVVIQHHEYGAGFTVIVNDGASPPPDYWLDSQMEKSWACSSAKGGTLVLMYEFYPLFEFYPIFGGRTYFDCGGNTVLPTAVDKITGKTTRYQAKLFCAAKHKIAKAKKGRALKRALRSGTSKFRCAKPKKRAHKRPFGS